MSGFDPLAALAAQVVAGAEAAIEQATLDLGAVVQEIRAQIAVGDIVNATVLPPQDGNDRISFLGQNVTAQLPPGIDPGDTIALQVTGFTSTAILVRNLGEADPENPPQAAELPPPPAGALPAQTAVLSTALPQNPNPKSGGTALSVPPASVPVPRSSQQPQPAPQAPPREVFVAASVRDSIPTRLAAELPPRIEAAPLDELEARIALTRAGSGAQPPTAAPAGAPATAQTRAAKPAIPPPLTPTIPPIITARPTDRAQPPPVPVASSAPAAPPSPEVALLTRLRVPVSAATLVAARAIGEAAQAVSSSYQKLEALLSSVPQDDRTTALRSALAFVGRMDLRNVRALPEQIASFVANVVDGAESKIAQIVRAFSAAAENAAAQEVQSQQPGRDGAQPPAVPPTALEARVAERLVALDHDVKSAILAMIEAPPNGASPPVVAALRQALIATNALQLNVLSGKSSDANTVTIPLPAFFYEGGRPAQLAISRDGRGGKNALDNDNFHVAFILDTKSLGTVAIDLQAVGRSVTVDVKTQATAFADRFRSSLGDLTSRLESLHYRVAAIAAGVAVSSQPQVEPEVETRGRSTLDARA